MNEFKLIRPSKLHRDKILAFREEFFANAEKVISGGELLDKLEFDEWIDYVQRNSDAATVSADWVLTDVFFAWEDDDIVGVISFRHRLNDFLKDWGHIGYSVRPSCRRKKIATRMLAQVVSYAKNLGIMRLQLSCYNDNVASCKTIKRNGGKYLRSFKYLDNMVDVYIIDIENPFNYKYLSNNC